MSTPLRVFVSCAPGIEPWLADELRALGAAKLAVEPGGVSCEGDRVLLHRTNLELGLASHVLVRVAELGARHFGELARKVAKIDWSTWLSASEPIRVRVSSRRSRLHHTKAIAQRIVGGIEHSLGRELSLSEDGVPVVARLDRDRCTLSLDSSGAPLHRRGWRLQTAKAPLREDLARALVLASGWSPDMPLVDPMMGSGTIVVEAACLARRLAPGRLRTFALHKTPLFDPTVMDRLCAEAAARSLPRAPAPIVGRDRAAGALEAARGNASRAGILEDLVLVQADLRETPLPRADRGTLVTNPPYGQRIGAEREARTLLRRLGERIADLGPSWRVALVLPEGRMARATGLRLRPAFMTDHGGTKIVALTGPARPGSEAAP